MSEVLDSLRSYRSCSGSSYSSRRSEKMRVYNMSETSKSPEDLEFEEDGCESFLMMDVGQPVTITVRESVGSSESFTTYLIRVETNYPTFSRTFSAVRRRYSEFCWLRNHLRSSYPRENIPSLPPKKYLRVINFSAKVIEGRCRGLSRFLQRVLETPLFLSDPALILFVQSEMEIQDIEKQIQLQSGLNCVRPIDEVEVELSSNSSRRSDSESISEAEDHWKKHSTLQRSSQSMESEEEEEDSVVEDSIVRKTPSPCSSSGSVKTDDSGHFEDSGSTSSLEKSLHKNNVSGQKIKSTLLPRKVSCESEQLPPHRKLSLNDYMAFDPISRYLLENPSVA